ncbi:DUF3618 domain-containing protein [Fodinicola feengrottensis]|uniref:DUF3618 domain-containing protein n=1 Tax=Fodinicola feengrottensis TaxID=435914 RepID=A0ABN2IHE6_9ACTN|nr:DUF3618 domain-containing protein [Fodinicola feengrottensis]
MTAEQVKPAPTATDAQKPVELTEAELHADIARLRVELGGTVDQLAGRLDVRKQAEEKIAQGRAALIQKAPVIGAAIGIGLLAIGVLVVLRGRKKKS